MGYTPDEAKAIKTKLIAFFKQHSPKDLYRVEDILKIGMPEKKLFADLRQKYKVSETPEQIEGDMKSSVEDLRARLTAFYKVYANNDVAKVDLAMTMNVPEVELFKSLYTKYNVPEAQRLYHTPGKLPPSTAAAAGATSAMPQASPSAKASDGNAQLRQRLRDFYAIHNPSDVEGKVDTALKMGLSEEKLFAALHEKYGLPPPSAAQAKPPHPNPSAKAPVVSGAVGEQATSQDALRLKLEQFYTGKVPEEEKEAKVKLALTLSVSEDALFQKLYEKYNLGPDGKPKQQAAAPVQASTGFPSPGVQMDFVKDDQLRDRLRRFYASHGATDVEDKIEMAVAMGLPESELFSLLETKYATQSSDVTVAIPPEIVVPPGKEALCRRLVQFYTGRVPAPEVIAKTKLALGLNVPEADLMAKIYEKYGLGPDGNPKPGALNASTSAVIQPSSSLSTADGNPTASATDAAVTIPPEIVVPPGKEALCRRLVQFYTGRVPAPEVIAKTKLALGLNVPEADLMAKIYEKYGLGPDGNPKPGALNASTSAVIQPSSSMSTADGNPTASATDAAVTIPPEIVVPPGKEALCRRLVQFYTGRVPAPEVIAKTKLALGLNVPEADLMAKIYEKYGLGPDGNPKPAALNASTSAVIQPSSSVPSYPHRTADEIAHLQTRLTAFFESRLDSPAEVQREVAAALATDLSEDDLFLSIYKRFDLGPDGKPNNHWDTILPSTAPPPPLSAAHAELRKKLVTFFARIDNRDPAITPNMMADDSIQMVVDGHMTEKQLVVYIQGQFKAAPDLFYEYEQPQPTAPLSVSGAPSSIAKPEPLPAQAAAIPPVASSSARVVSAAVPSAQSGGGLQPQPSATNALSMDDVRQPPEVPRAAFRKRLTEFYEFYKVPDIEEKIAVAFSINAPEEVIFEKLYSKYGEAPEIVRQKELGRQRRKLEEEYQKTQKKEKLKERLLAFYAVHNPGNVANVDAVIEVDVPEEVLFATLYDMYGLDKHGEAVKGGATLNALDTSATLTSNIKAALSSALAPSSSVQRNTPVPLFQSPLSAQHSASRAVEDNDEDVIAQSTKPAALERREIENRLFLFFVQNHTAEEAKALAALVMLKRRPEESKEEFIERVKLDPGSFVNLPSSNSSPPVTAQRVAAPQGIPVLEAVSRDPALGEKLTMFYSQYNPGEVDRVQSIVASKLPDDRIWARLRERYGPAAVAPFVGVPTQVPSLATPPNVPSGPRDEFRAQSDDFAIQPPPSLTKRQQQTNTPVDLLDALVAEAMVHGEVPPTKSPDKVTPRAETSRSLREISFSNKIAFPSSANVLPPPDLLEAPPQRYRTVVFLVSFPDVSVYTVRTSADSLRDVLLAAIEQDIKAFCTVHGANYVHSNSTFTSTDDMLCLRFESIFRSESGAALFLKQLLDEGSYAAVPVPNARAAYVRMGGNAHSIREGKLSHAVLKITEDNVVAAVTAQERGSGQRSPDGKLQQIKSILQGGRGEAPRRSPVSPTAGAPATFPSGAFESPSAAEPIRLLSTVGGGAKSAPRALLENGVTWAEIDEAIGGASSAVSGPQPSSGAVRSVSREDYVRLRERELLSKELELDARARELEQKQRAIAPRMLGSDEGRDRREQSADVAVKFESLQLRDLELKELERTLSRREEVIADKERMLQQKVREIQDTQMSLQKREDRLALLEQQLQERIAQHDAVSPKAQPFQYLVPKAENIWSTADEGYVRNLEERLKEANSKLAQLQTAPIYPTVGPALAPELSTPKASPAMGLHGSPQLTGLVYPAQRESFRPSPGPVLGTPEVDTRLRHVIEREALVTQAEAELDKRVQDALQTQRRQEQTASAKWDILRSQDRELLSRRLELEATKNMMQPATSRVSSEYSSPPPQFASSSRSVHSSTKSPSPRPLSNPSSVAPPSQIPQGSSSSAFSLKPRDEDITSMLRRVKEREMMLRSITEKMPSAKMLR